MNSENYRDQFLSLLPPGKAVSRLPSSGVGRMMHGLAVESARVETRVKELISESIPSTVDELLTEWETDFDLQPDGTTSQRIAALTAKVIEVGQQNPGYFEDIISKYGFDSDIYQFTPAWSGVMTAGDACGNQYMLFYWLVDILDSTTADAMKAMMKEIIRLKPGHTQVFFDYPGSTVTIPRIEFETSMRFATDSGGGDDGVFTTDESILVNDSLIGCFLYSVEYDAWFQIIDTTYGTDITCSTASPDILHNTRFEIWPSKSRKIISLPPISNQVLHFVSGYTNEVQILGIEASTEGSVAIYINDGSESIAENDLQDCIFYHNNKQYKIVSNSASIGGDVDAIVDTIITETFKLQKKFLFKSSDILFTSAKNRSPGVTVKAVPTNIFLFEYCEVGIIYGLHGTNFADDELAGMTVDIYSPTNGVILYSKTIVRNSSQNAQMTDTTIGTVAAQGAGTYIITFAEDNEEELDGLLGSVIESTSDYIENIEPVNALEGDELAGAMTAVELYGWVTVVPDPFATAYAPPGSDTIMNCWTNDVDVGMNQLAGMRISGMYDDGVTPFSFTIMSNTMKDSFTNFFSVVIYGTTRLDKTIEDQGFVVEKYAPIGQVKYLVNGNDTVFDGIFDSGFSKGFIKT